MFSRLESPDLFSHQQFPSGMGGCGRNVELSVLMSEAAPTLYSLLEYLSKHTIGSQS
jgi:hypothetical protein